ncbi:MAG: ThuA domain-containing protein, partial [Isosphaeraceae bacterium]
MNRSRWLVMVAICLAFTNAAFAQEKKRRLLVVAECKGYQHEAIPTAMVTLFNLGKSSKLWETTFRTDCAAITKKPLKWGARNLDAYNAVAFFTDGDLDMDGSQKADLLS